MTKDYSGPLCGSKEVNKTAASYQLLGEADVDHGIVETLAQRVDRTSWWSLAFGSKST